MLSKGIKQRLNKSIEAFLLHLSCRSSARQTIHAYRYELNRFIALSERLKNNATTVKQALKEQRLLDTVSLRYQDNPNISSFTIRRYVCAYRSWIQYLLDTKTLPPEFGRFYFTLPKLPQVLPKAIPESSLQALLSFDTKGDWIALRNQCIFELMALSGLRIGEVIGLELANLSLATLEIKVFGKGSVERIVPISESTAQKIRQYLNLSSEKIKERTHNCLFVSNSGQILHHSTIRNALSKHAQSAGIRHHITPHSLRHSCATHFVKKTKDLRFVQLLLGHRNISTTQVYVHLDHEYINKTFNEYCLKID